jgi:transformation/transcription domain-associated protein
MMPFRLTPNLVHFIGKIGLEGLFAGVMTSASLALGSQEHKLSALLKLIFTDEIDTLDKQMPNQP